MKFLKNLVSHRISRHFRISRKIRKFARFGICQKMLAESASHPSVLRRTEGLSMASQVSFGRNLKKNNQKIVENTLGISGNTYFAKFGKIDFCMQPEILEMYFYSASHIHSTILWLDSDSAHQLMQILMLKSEI